MQLSKIYKRYALITLALALVISSMSHYLVITHFVHRSADHTLKEYRQNIGRHVEEYGTLEISDNTLLNRSRLTSVVVPDDFYVKENIRDTLVHSNYKRESVVFRLLSYTIMVGDSNFLITLWQSTVDTDDLFWAVTVSLIILFVLFSLFSLVSTKWFVGRLWRPFYQILGQLKEVDLINLHPIKISTNRVDEFKILNRTLNRMIDRIQGDYISLRELTETTSHELQTPLSIVKARLELLQQGECNSQEQTELIRSVGGAVDRVIRLNRFMLMIVKINNNQFPASNHVVLNDFLDDFVSSYEDVIEVKGLSVIKQYAEPLKLNLNAQLAEIMVSNLLSNAIRYNTKGGYIKIQTSATTLNLINPYRNEIPAGDLFVRFKKSGGEKDATGLGLAIVKSICQKNNMEVSTEIADGLFCLSIKTLGNL